MRFRKQLIVQPKFQRWFSLWFMACTASLLVFVGGSIYFWFKMVDETMFRLMGLIGPSALTLVRLNADMAIKVSIVLSLFIVGFAAIQSLIFSHKIAGPLFAFLRHLMKCEKKGRLEKITLRKGDLFMEIAESFNRVVDAINSKQAKEESQMIALKPLGSEKKSLTHIRKINRSKMS